MRRREDAPLLTGRGRYVADFIRPGMLALSVVRSGMAHARIAHVDLGGIRHRPGYVGVLTCEDLPAGTGWLPAADLVEGSAAVHHTVLAGSVVRYAGEPLLAVLATDAYAAEDLAEQVKVEYEPLAPVMDVDGALRDAAPLLYPQSGSNVVHQTVQQVGDPDAAFAAAATVVEETLRVQRVAASSMEPRAVVATLEETSGRCIVYSSTQIPQVVRRELARITGIPSERLRVIAPDIGGGFGAKEAVYPEEVLVLLALQKFGRPAYWIEDRQEAFVATSHGRDETIHVRAAVDASGMVTAVDVDCLADIGAAYSLLSNTSGAAIVTMRGPYRIGNFRSRARSVVTNKTPLNVYRGAGYPEATLAMERIMDLAAAATGLDRAELRRRNLLQPAEFPVDRGVSYPGCGRVVLDSGDYPALLASTLDAIGYAGLAARRAGCKDGVSLGLGLSFVVEMSGGGGPEPAQLRLLPDGRLQLLTGIVPIGQGTVTTLAQILADHLHVPMDSIEILTGDTDDSPDAPGTFASRGATMGGNAVCMAADAFVLRARSVAAELLGLRPEDLEWRDGAFWDCLRPGYRLTLAGLAGLATGSGGQAMRQLDISVQYRDDAVSWSSGCHAAVVEVDRAIGSIRVLDYAVTHDCGRMANPMLVDAQIIGGVVQGLGQCLFEAIRYDGDGLPLCRGYMDYVLPTAATAPKFHLRHIETPSPLNPLGMKGAGESGCTGAVAAVSNAIADALGPDAELPAGSGPFTPELIRQALRTIERKRTAS